MRYDFVDLKLFRAIAQTSSLSAGAAHVFLSAGSASYRLKNLEQSVGTRLFQRTPKGMSLTPAGECLLGHVVALLAELERMHGDMSGFAKGMRGSVRLLANSSSLNGVLPADLSSFLSAHRQCNIELEECGSEDIVLAVGDGLADIGIVASDIETGLLQVFPYAVDELILAVAKSHPLALSLEVRFEDALGYEFVCMNRASSNYQFLLRTCTRLGKHLNVRIHVHSFATVLQLARDNIGIALVPRRVFESNSQGGGCVAVRLADEWAVRRLKIVARDILQSPPLTRMLVDHLLRTDNA